MKRDPVAQRFVGEICGFGSRSARRVVIGRWPSSPFGPFADAMVEDSTGHRTLIAPTPEIAAYIAAIYDFDEVTLATVSCHRSNGQLLFKGGPLDARVQIGRRDGLGWLLRCVPRPLATSPRWATMVDPLARRLLTGVRTRGSTVGGTEFYGATDRHKVVAIDATWHGKDVGTVADVLPPVRFGFGSAPLHPSIVEITTTVVPHRRS